jgi:hypothetical protein
MDKLAPKTLSKPRNVYDELDSVQLGLQHVEELWWKLFFERQQSFRTWSGSMAVGRLVKR